MGVPVSTLAYEPGHTVTERVGIVAADHTINPSDVGEWFSGMRDYVGGNSGVWSNNARKAREEIVNEVSEQAAAAGADMVLGLTFRMAPARKGSMILVSAEGMAVRIAKSPA